MKLVQDLSEMTALAASWRGQGQKIALVPTMGWFHAGHLALMRQARQSADKVVVSLFVNPIQFGPGEDLAAYPRDLQRDMDLAAGEKVDVLYAPSVPDMYPAGFQTTIRVAELGLGLCGASRPGHFDGVCTVVMKLFHQIQPHLAVFGEKDFQQLAVIRRMVRDLDLAVDIVAHPIVREANGLAMSSRNSYLQENEKEHALCLYRAIILAREKVKNAVQPLLAAELCAELEEHIHQVPGCVVDYVEIVDIDSLKRCKTVAENSRLILAVKVNERVRLIDNARLYEL
ncbi:MAG: pantoate--beta-alanine ligase [Desulfocapsa sp.]|nr:pantoate--beta-alanine ligase [Desulfocapsa sp.]MBU3945325.1 pantoate--beta-alanine ligase [Pseudomonadota bacterium]MCG2744713.1 pantoate--beta-alanine ligase [Desulfobacteraceae bacterium]MBU3983674.1 pantoate--beta-alanine ligase [Pseudomonadota bacterium]MBU4084472.1 pantoate--beta-alanine ligase [Pseudomonadota bacterium]